MRLFLRRILAPRPGEVHQLSVERHVAPAGWWDVVGAFVLFAALGALCWLGFAAAGGSW